MTDAEGFFAERRAAPERVNGRYKMVGPDGREDSYQTASNYAFPVVDQFGLNRWRSRQILLGLARRADLQAIVATMNPEQPDNGKLDEVIETALQVAGTSSSANLGTAVHAALEAADEGRAYPPEYESYVEYYRAALARHGLKAVAVERVVVNPALGAAGKLDRVYEEADGGFVLGDVKTSGHLDLGAHEHSVQCSVYATASHIRTPDGKGWQNLEGVRTDYAVIVHVDRDSGAVAVYRVDLTIGRHGANLAEQVRGWRKSGPVLLPYVPPITAFPPTGRDTDGGQFTPYDAWTYQPEPAPDEGARRTWEGIDQVYQLGEWMDLPPEVTPDELAQGGWVTAELAPNGGVALSPFLQAAQSEVDEITVQQKAKLETLVNGTKAHVLEAPDVAPPAVAGVLRSAEDLLRQKVTKAQVQEYCRQVGMTDLAHNKKVLIDMLRQDGKLAPAGTPAPDAAPKLHPGGPPPPRPDDPSDPRTVAFVQLHLGRIKVAATVGELQTIHNAVVRAGGEQAWTPELTEAGRRRVAELDAANVVPEGPTVMDRINAAQTIGDLATLYDEVTLNNTVPGNWTPEVDQYSKDRLAQLNASRPAAPANPFASG